MKNNKILSQNYSEDKLDLHIPIPSYQNHQLVATLGSLALHSSTTGGPHSPNYFEVNIMSFLIVQTFSNLKT